MGQKISFQLFIYIRCALYYSDSPKRRKAFPILNVWFRIRKLMMMLKTAPAQLDNNFAEDFK